MRGLVLLALAVVSVVMPVLLGLYGDRYRVLIAQKAREIGVSDPGLIDTVLTIGLVVWFVLGVVALGYKIAEWWRHRHAPLATDGGIPGRPSIGGDHIEQHSLGDDSPNTVNK